jgi:hypothetical protein
MITGSLGEIVNWLLLAFGAALFGGTGAALLTYRRTGAFPGQPKGARPSVATAVGKCLAGAALMIWAIAGITAL